MSLSNPFSSRFIAPGGLEYQFFGRGSTDELVDRILAAPDPFSAIIGPHGSGKSTLLAHLMPELATRAKPANTHWIRLSADGKANRSLSNAWHHWQSNDVVVIDGFEQLSLWCNILFRMRARQRRWQVLVTAHSKLRGFQTVWETTVMPESEQWVVRQLLSEHGDAVAEELLASEAWRNSRKRHNANLRESLFDMYDWWHERK